MKTGTVLLIIFWVIALIGLAYYLFYYRDKLKEEQKMNASVGDNSAINNLLYTSTLPNCSATQVQYIKDYYARKGTVLGAAIGELPKTFTENADGSITWNDGSTPTRCKPII